MSEQFWKVSVKDSNGDVSDYSAERTFNLVGAAPVLLTPPDESTADGTLFTWDHVGQGGAQEAFSFRRRSSPVGSYMEEVDDGGITSLLGGSRFVSSSLLVDYSDPENVTVDDLGLNEVKGTSADFTKALTATSSSVELFDTSVWSSMATQTINTGSVIYKAAFSPDGNYIALPSSARVTTVGGGSTFYGGVILYIFDASNLDILATYGFPDLDISTGENNPARVQAAVFSPDSSRLYIALSDNADTAPYFRIIDTIDWTFETGHPTLPGRGRSLALLDSPRLAIGYSGGDGLSVYDTTNWSLESGTPSLSEPFSLTYNSGLLGVRSFSVNSDMVRIFNTSTWDPADSPLAFCNSDLVFSDDGTHLLMGSGQNHTRFAIWIISENDFLNTQKLSVLTFAVWGIGSRGDALGLGTDNGFEVFHLPQLVKLPVLRTGTRRRTSIDVHLDLGYLACTFGENDQPMYEVVDISDGSLVSVPALPGFGRFARFSNDGAFLVLAHSLSPFITVVDTSTWTAISTDIPDGTALWIAFSPDGNRMITTHLGPDRVLVWDTSSWSVLQEVAPDPDFVYRAEYSKDGSKLALVSSTAGADPFLWILDTVTWAAMSGIALTEPGTSVAFFGGDRYVAIGRTSSPQFRIIDLQTGDEVFTDLTPEVSTSGGFTQQVRLTDANDRVFLSSSATVARAWVFEINEETSWWDGSGWVSEEVFVISGDETVSLPPGAWE